MPKLGMQSIRRRQLIDATLEAINEVGMHDATIAQIARRAGVSTGIISHYFRDKNGLLEATMRDITSQLRDAVLNRLHALPQGSAEQRLQAIVGGNFDETQVSSAAMKAWLAFWASSMHQPMLYRLQQVSSRRLLSNLVSEFRRELPREQAQEAGYGLGLILFVLFMGDTSFLLNALVLNVGDYVNRFMGMTLNSFAFDRPVEWMNNWTLFFWAWWVAWSPFVGLFLARISRGRTIRQFVLGTLIIPFTFTLLWLSVFGNSALYEIIHGGAAFAEEAMVHPERGFYSLLAQYPAFTFSASVATITGLLFYVTSADSGALVLGNFTSQLKDINSDAPGWLRVFWSVAIGLLTLGMLMTNGISALQNTTVIMGLPFSFVIFFVMAGLYKSLKVEDYRRESANRDTAPRPLGLQDRLSWKKRLSRLMNYPGTRYTKQMMETVCYPAMEEVAQELRLRGAYVELKSLPPEEGQQLGHLDLLVHMGEEQNFVYQIWPQQYSVPGFTYRARSGKSTYYRLETFLLEGSQGNDLMDYSKEQVITDILDQYERHLNFIHLHREAPGHSVMFPDA